MTDTSYQSALDWLYGLVDYETAGLPRNPANFNLRRVALILERLDNPHLKVRTVHIAGSKGKGSTAAMIAAVLSRAGYRTGLYTSPHLSETTERFKVDGSDMTPEEFVAGIGVLRPLVTEINASPRYGRLTVFEVMTALGFMFFAGRGAVWQVIETGLGGRLDATNVVLPELTVLTSIGLEHTEVLGHTLAAIAGEKAGIIKPGVPVVSAPQPPEALAVIEQVAAERNAQLVTVDLSLLTPSVVTGDRQSFIVTGQRDTYRVNLPLLGGYQRLNAAVALQALETLADRGLELEKADIESGLAAVVWPGRFQIVSRRPWTIIDGAHTPAAAAEFVGSLRSMLLDRPRPAVLVIGVSADKDVAGMAEPLAPFFDVVIAVATRHPRAMPAGRLADAFRPASADVRTADSVKDAVKSARAIAGDEGLVAVTGSLFAVGEALEMFRTDGIIREA
ncbi:FolC bifunctional protein [Dehalogenimonas lykanthroporepellens BL-DC-9]|jgi:dihydrofolate synthase/folylpolyglutamate synthase|nr:FolC bifunctional protein [Dehalogenimonas lykanthroporepellens BL-DC-9]